MRPKELYFTDVTYLKDLGTPDLLYILNVIDWGSKYMFSWLIGNKKA
jgi:hypothetical protein